MGKLYRDILDKKSAAIYQIMKMKWGWTFQQDNDPKHSQGNSQMVLEKEIKLLE